jgi:hypothetical protein
MSVFLLGFLVLSLISRTFAPLRFVPVGVIFAISAVAGIFEGRRAYSRKDRELHANWGLCCAKCGYDIRASVSRCPECGAWIECPLKPPR